MTQCINKKEVEEKNLQVAMMGKTYQRTRMTTIWLGPEEIFTRPALDLCFRLAEKPMLLTRASRHMPDSAACKALSLLARDSSQWWSVFAFLQRAWFRRIWVIQELALAPAAQVQCGQLDFRGACWPTRASTLHESGLGYAMMLKPNEVPSMGPM